MWLSLKKIAAYLDVSESWVKQRHGVDFIKGVHYVKKEGVVRYSVAKIEEWMREETENGERIQPSGDTLDKRLQGWKESSEKYKSRRYQRKSQDNNERVAA